MLLDTNLLTVFTYSKANELGKIVAEGRVLLAHLFIFHPAIEAVLDDILPNLKHVFGLLAASLLQTPSGRVVEV